MNRLPAWFVPASTLAVIVVMSAIASWQVLSALGLPLSRDEYNLGVWEVRHFPNKWLYLIGHIGSGSSRSDENADVTRYLELQHEVDDLTAQLAGERDKRLAGATASDDGATGQRAERTRLYC